MAVIEGLASLEGMAGYAAKKALCLRLRQSYPVIHVAALMGPQDKRPEVFRQESPDLSFARVVLREARTSVWFFRDLADRDRYRHWCMSPADNPWERPDLEGLPPPPQAVSPLS